ncbi:hypothetical protein AMEX_G8230 [Astyanax mexicanus]|uniref:Uncharacterized protein n=1 Tax=Astyanax mexicanus TaxID=7994 RepID=A0A8T2LVM1_ASTMX|nr:hypothetical protein AMEX_G8230 [Astyanax mexicanus]
MPSTSSVTTSKPGPRPRPKQRSYPLLDILPPVPADQFAGAQRQAHCSPPQKIKRLKTRKERNQIRGPNISSFFFQSHVKKVSKDKAQGCSCQESHSGHSHKHFIKDKTITKLFHPHRPSIITEGRLTSSRGLFSHEVRSVDIERLMTDRRKSQSQAEDHQAAADNSLSVSSPLIFSPRPESGEPVASISRCVQDVDGELALEQTNHLQTITEEHSYMLTCHESLENVVGSGHRSSNKTKPAVLSSTESDFIQSFSTPDPPNKTGPPYPPGEREEEPAADKTTTADKTPLDKQQRTHNPLIRSLQSDPAVCTVVSPTTPAANAQQIDPDALISSEAIGRLAARLCQDLPLTPLRCHLPLLTECREVLLQALQERNSQTGLHLQLTTPTALPDLRHQITEQASSSSQQRYGESTPTPMHFSFTRGYEDKSSRRDFVREDVYPDTERGAGDERRRRPHVWTVYSPQDVFTKLQSPCEDLLDQWSVRIPVPESLTANQLHKPLQRVSLHQAFTAIETPKPYSNSYGPESAKMCFLKPQKQEKPSISQNTVREINALLDQWSSDPDLAFLFHENVRRSHTSSDHLTEPNSSSPYQKVESARGRPPAGASSTVSAFFPPEGFTYEPYYRFPHPLNVINRPERSSSSPYILSDIRDLGLSPSLLLNTPYFRYSL